jgi:hypothetical protein
MDNQRLYEMPLASIYPLYIAKVEKKGRSKAELDEIIQWLTGYSQNELEIRLEQQTDLQTFFNDAPCLNPARRLINGLICGVRVESIKEPMMQEIRYLDKLVDELAKGKALDKIVRKQGVAT